MKDDSLPATQTATTVEPPASQDSPVVTNPVREFVASAVDYSFLVADRGLPQTIDDAERDIGDDIYDRMMNDAIISGCIWLLKVLCLADGLTIIPAVDDPGEDAKPEEKARYEEAVKYADFVRYCVEQLEGSDRSIMLVLWEMLDALYKGHRLAEVTLRLQKRGRYSGKYVLKSIKPKPRKNYAYVLDTYNTLVGVMAIVPGVALNLRRGIIWNPAKLPNVLAPDKIFRLTIGGKEGNPNGDSLLRPAYDPWFRSQIGKPEEVKTAVQFGGGMISAVMGENTPATDPATGEPTRDLIVKALAQLFNGGLGVFPNGTVITVHNPSADPKFFDAYFNRTNIEKATAIILNARSILEAQHGAKNDTDKAENVLDELRNWLRGLVCLSLRPVFRTLIVKNFSEDAAEDFTPKASMARNNRPDFALNAQGLAAVGFELDPSQFQGIDEEYGLPKRSDDAIQRALDKAANPQPAPGDPNAPLDAKKDPAKQKFQHRRGGNFDG